MAERFPTSTVNITQTWSDNALERGDPTDVIPWEDVRDRIARASDYWVATVRASGAPHVRPVFAVWVDGLLVSTTNGKAPRPATSRPTLGSRSRPGSTASTWSSRDRPSS